MTRSKCYNLFFIMLFTVCLTAFVFTASPCDAAKMKRILVVETMPVPVVLEYSKWFMNGMRDLGYQDENVQFEILRAEGSREKAEKLLREAMEKGKPDLVVTFATLASQAAYTIFKGTDVPILFSVVADPVGAGIVKNIGKSTGTNITGRVYSLFRDVKIDLTMRLVRQVVQDRPVRFGFVYSNYPSSRGDLKGLQSITKDRRDVVFVPYEIKYREVPTGIPDMLHDVSKGLKELTGKIDFLWQQVGPMAEVKAFTELQIKEGSCPIALGNTMNSVQRGALIAVIPNIERGGREVAGLANSILKGANPGDIPVIVPQAFDLCVNLTTAIKLGIVIPSDMLTLAGKHIYR
ncbi:putative ABC transport system substrate-binding protein [Maridesulfovibrio ferrireducens]|uniref:Putative ABC transport system substrate-binding protein n=1 Tax=Maridesulfovibrio ferrireducens TaxID=246191 RepID=A0A1G9KQB0_9BACT|nr:ABC transporter substrate binding protein [Maridesulfovibrio ferrireducens]SDL51891.1 putative ABC transport system substrate-binding protein [Maridesulfovibrio ferrireducens]